MIEESEKKVTEPKTETPRMEAEAAHVEAVATETPQTEAEAPIVEETEEVSHQQDEVTVSNENSASDENSTGETFVADLGDEDDDDEDWWKDEDDYSTSERNEMETLYNSTLRQFNENEIVQGIVVSIGEKETILNIGFKSEGILQNSEFRDTPDLKPGDEIEVFIETVEDSEGQLILSRKRAKSMRTWEKINSSMDSDTILQGTVNRRTKGGFVVELDGIEAFLPGSQIDVKPVRDFDAYVGRTMEFKVVKINHAYENVVVSHKVLIEEKLEEQRGEILKNLDKGQVLEGTVKNMTNFGVFIDLGGVDGLLHITDISWGRINHPEEVLELDQKVNIVVLDFDEAKKRISLGMKQLTPHPWDSLSDTIAEGSSIKGKVVTVADYGIFLEIMPGVEGLIHTSEMSWSQHAKNPTESYKVGDELEAVVLNVDREDRKMSLGLKQLQEDPWDSVQTKYPMDSRHTGKVRNMTNYGLFVELEEGVDGLVHISDLSWTKKFGHPSEYVKLGDDLEVVVLAIDIDNRRLSLGHKQLTEDVWETFATIFVVGTRHTGTINKIDSKGARVELEHGVEGTVPGRHLKVAEGKPDLKVEDSAEFEVIEFNKDAKKLILSHTRTWKEDMPEERQKSSAGAPVAQKRRPAKTPAQTQKQSTTTLGDIAELAKLKEKMEASEGKPKAKAKPKKVEKVEEAAPAVEAAAPAKEAAPVVEAAAVVEEAAPKKKAPAKKKAASKDKGDDLKKIEGIGPKIASILNEGGITTFAQLGETEAGKVKEMLAAAGDRFKSHDPTTWPKQAALAAEGKWDELKEWQDVLDGGRIPAEEDKKA